MSLRHRRKHGWNVPKGQLTDAQRAAGWWRLQFYKSIVKANPSGSHWEWSNPSADLTTAISELVDFSKLTAICELPSAIS